MLEKDVMKNANGDVYKILPVSEDILTDKKVNTAFWDQRENEAEQYFIESAKKFGVSIEELNDIEIGKEITEMIYDTLRAKGFIGKKNFIIDADL
ncbi:hypothetical protein [Priestia aryabhattai]